MKKILLLPFIIALTSNIYAIPSPWYVLTALLPFLGAENTNIRQTYTTITGKHGGQTPGEQMKYIETLPKGCSSTAQKYLTDIEEVTLLTGAATCSIPRYTNQDTTSVTVTRKLPKHILQSFCQGKKRGIMKRFETSNKTVKLFFNPDGTLDGWSADESAQDFRAGYETSYTTTLIRQEDERTCISGNADTFPAVEEADDESLEYQRGLGIIANLDPNGVYDGISELAAQGLSKVIGEANAGDTIEYFQNVDDDLIITSVYKGAELLGYELFMRNEDGTCEVVHLNEALAIGHSYELRQRFDVLAENTGSEALVVTSGKGEQRKVIRYNPALANKHEDKPLDSSTQCTITEHKVNGKVVRIERTGDCDEL